MLWSGLFIVWVTVDAYAMVGIMPFSVNRQLGKRQSGKSVFKKVMSSTSSIDKKFDFTFLGNSYENPDSPRATFICHIKCKRLAATLINLETCPYQSFALDIANNNVSWCSFDSFPVKRLKEGTLSSFFQCSREV